MKKLNTYIVESINTKKFKQLHKNDEIYRIMISSDRKKIWFDKLIVVTKNDQEIVVYDNYTGETDIVVYFNEEDIENTHSENIEFDKYHIYFTSYEEAIVKLNSLKAREVINHVNI